MKTKFFFFSLILACICFTGISQAPKGFNYQAIARDASGNAIVSTTIPVKIAIQTSLSSGVIYEETFNSITTNQFGLINLVIGTGTATVGTFASVNWNQTLYVKTSVKYPSTSPTWTDMGTSQMWSVPYSLVADKANGVNTGSKLSVTSTNDAGTDALFEVKRADGQTVFAVYPTAVQIYVPKSVYKGVRGGFSVGGFDGSKSGSPTTVQDYLRVTADSVRVYVDPNSTAPSKGVRGGFAVGGYDEAKGTTELYFNLNPKTSVLPVGAKPQVLWYPNKNAFLAGNIHIAHIDSVGSYSTALGYQSRAIGNYSQAFGYKATAFGNYSTSIGKYSIAGVYKSKHNAFALGNAAQALGEESYAFGSGAKATGAKSFAFGSAAIDSTGAVLSTLTTASGDYSTAIGMGAQSTNTGAITFGTGAIASGYISAALGYGSSATNKYGVAIGYLSQSTGIYGQSFGMKAKAIGQGSLAVGSSAYASGLNSSAVGYYAQATNSYALALGYGSVASGTNATAIGMQSSAQGDKSIALGSFYSYSYYIPIINLGKGDAGSSAKGIDDFLPIRITTPITTFYRTFSRQNIAQGQYSVAIGNGNLATNGGLVFGSNSTASKFGALALGMSATASEANSGAMGYNTIAKGIYSMAIGNNLKAISYGEIALGQWNDTLSGTKDSWNENDLLLTVGNGVNDANRSNALTIYKNGSTILRGRYANSTFNLKTARLFYNPITHLFYTRDYVYGMYSNLSRDDASIEYYYSGYFTSTGSNGTYYGLYADKLTTPSANLTGTITASSTYSTAVGSTYRPLYIDNTGLIGYLSSSARYKKDIESLTNVDWLYQLRPVTYRYKTSSSAAKNTGLIAEEVLKCNPNFVSFNDKGEPETVLYQDLITPLLKAVQDQKSTIDELKSENADLNKRIERLEAIISNLDK